MRFNGYSVTFLFVGKTLLAKAVANQTAATFLRVVGSELIQKYLVRKVIIIILFTAPNVLMTLCSLCSVPGNEGKVCQLMKRDISKQ